MALRSLIFADTVFPWKCAIVRFVLHRVASTMHVLATFLAPLAHLRQKETGPSAKDKASLNTHAMFKGEHKTYMSASFFWGSLVSTEVTAHGTTPMKAIIGIAATASCLLACVHGATSGDIAEKAATTDGNSLVSVLCVERPSREDTEDQSECTQWAATGRDVLNKDGYTEKESRDDNSETPFSRSDFKRQAMMRKKEGR